MSLSMYFVDLFYTRSGDSAPAWHRTDHGTLQAARLHARHYAQELGRENVGLFERYPTELDF
jgi:hypothetical protein